MAILIANIALAVLNIAGFCYILHKVNHKIKVMEYAVFRIPHLPSYLNHVEREERLIDDNMGTMN